MKRKSSVLNITKPIIGWRESISLPELGIEDIKAKIDTGAKTSALHVTDYSIKTLRNKKRIVEFTTHPKARTLIPELRCHAEFIEYRHVTSSNGHKSLRPVIITLAKIFEEIWPIEITLVNRDIMGFRMLLGREALNKKFLIDPSKSYLLRGKNKKFL